MPEIGDRTTLPLSWFFISLASVVSLVFAAGLWASSVNAKMEAQNSLASEHIAHIQRLEKHVEEHDVFWHQIDRRLIRIEFVTGADKVPMPKDGDR